MTPPEPTDHDTVTVKRNASGDVMLPKLRGPNGSIGIDRRESAPRGASTWTKGTTVSFVPTIDAATGRLVGEGGLVTEAGTLVLPGEDLDGLSLVGGNRTHLDGLLDDFGWVDDSDRANALALLLTPFVREVTGPAPLFMFHPARTRTGKTLLARLLLDVVFGRVEPTFLHSSRVSQEKALRQAIDRPDRVVFLDNVGDQLNHLGPLNSAIDGSLVGSERATFVLTPDAERFRVEDDEGLLARSVAIRLRYRPDWRHPHHPVEAWLRENRRGVVSGLLGLVSAWIDGGMPRAKPQHPVEGFGEWSDVVGGIFAVNGLEGFLGRALAPPPTLEEVWFRRFGSDWTMTTNAWGVDEIREAARPYVPAGNAQGFGTHLASRRPRGGYRFERQGRQWRVIPSGT